MSHQKLYHLVNWFYASKVNLLGIIILRIIGKLRKNMAIIFGKPPKFGGFWLFEIGRILELIKFPNFEIHTYSVNRISDKKSSICKYRGYLRPYIFNLQGWKIFFLPTCT